MRLPILVNNTNLILSRTASYSHAHRTVSVKLLLLSGGASNTLVVDSLCECQKLDYLGHVYVADSVSLASSSFT